MRSVKTLLVAGLIAATPFAANAQWYMGADAGVNFMQDPGVRGTDSDWGWVGLGQVGYSFGAPKVEFEYGYRGNDSISAHGPMANVLYDFMPNGQWHPFVGAGIGWAWLDGDFSGSTSKGSDNSFAYQGILGLGYDIDKSWALKGQYRYFATADADVGYTNDTADYRNHALTIGFTYKFGAPAAAPAPAPAPAPAAAVAPAPAPAPKASPVQKNFMVFFDFDKAEVSPEALKVIQQAAQAGKSGPAARIDLTGHADRSGSDKYNLKLSIKRGEAVKAQLVKLGIPASQIVVVGKGEGAPLVGTQDGVREPQNRRVEIVLP
ncbi:MAG: outer membrane beta-barrel protein [Magnetospirillum sp.]|nr:outer membrane beta-barrel protein [Magnetospirillum sp.]